MAERRMFHAGVVESDSFLDMSPGAQALYFHLGMQADDDGFVNGPRQVCRRCGARMEELQELLDGGFLLWFDGIAVVKHFRMANTLQNDRLKQLRYPEIAKKLYITPNRTYTTETGKRKENLYYVRERQIKEIKKRTGILLESIRKPRVSKPNQTQSNPTQPNQTQPNLIIGSTEEEKRIPTGICDAFGMTREEGMDYPCHCEDTERSDGDVAIRNTFGECTGTKDPSPTPTPSPQTYDDDRDVTLPSGLGNWRQDGHCARNVSGDSLQTYEDNRENGSSCHCEEPQATWQSQEASLKTVTSEVPTTGPRTGLGMTPGDTILLQEERQGVVHLTNEEAYKFLTTVGYHKGRYYVQKLAKFIKEHNANIKDHYAILMKWWQEDGGKYYG